MSAPLGDKRFDDLFMSLVSAHADLPSVLTTFFGWLHRRTDFYVVDADPRRAMGFAEGAAEKALLRAFHAFPFKSPPALSDDVRRASAAAAARASAATSGPRAAPSGAQAPQPGSSGQRGGAAPASTSAALGNTAAAAASSVAAAAAASGGAASTAASGSASTAAAQPPTAAGSSATGPSQPATPSPLATVARSLTAVRYTDGGLQVPVSNGGVGPGYWWEQTLSDVTLYVRVPRGVGARDVEVAVATTHLRLALRGARAPIIDADLRGAVKAGDAVWGIEATESGPGALVRPVDVARGADEPPEGCGLPPVDARALVLAAAAADGPATADAGGRVLTLHLDKAGEGWWRSATVGGPEIDAQRVDSEQPVESYDEETQAVIRKIMWDQGQKAKGLPTSDEIQAAAIAGAMRAAAQRSPEEGIASTAQRSPEEEFAGAPPASSQ